MASKSGDKLLIKRICNKTYNPCYLVCFDDLNILLDCYVDFTPLLHFLPQHPLLQPGASTLGGLSTKPVQNLKNVAKVFDNCYLNAQFEVGLPIEFDTILWDSIDAILISNYQSMLGLPFITQYTIFRGKIFATEPTINFGRLLMEDMLDCLSTLPKLTPRDPHLIPNITSSLRRDLYPLMSIPSCHHWHAFYTRDDVHQCISKIERIAYNQPVNLFNLATVECFSAGLAIGSCNWTLKTSSQKITYFSTTSLLYSHCKPIGVEHLLDSDVYLIGSVQATSAMDVQTAVNTFCDKVGETLRQGGNVLVPCSPCGIVFDLIESLRGTTLKDELSRVPIYVVSPQGKACLVFATSYGEWLNDMKLNELYLAHSPFSFEALMQGGLLLPVEDVTSSELNSKFRSPCVVFASHPSLRFGPAVYLLRLWANDPKNSLLLIHKEDTLAVPINLQSLMSGSGFPVTTGTAGNMRVDPTQLLSPFQPLQMRILHCPIDPSMTFTQLVDCLHQYPPKNALLLPEECLPHLDELGSTPHVNYCLTPGAPVALPFPRVPVKVEVHPELASHLQAYSSGAAKGDSMIFTGLAELQCRNAKYELTLPSGYTKDWERPALKGRVDCNKFLEELKARGLDAKAESRGDGDGMEHLVYLTEEDTLIRLEKNFTHIISDCEATRMSVRDALLSSFVISA